jgi:hypothetical protein
MAKARSWGGTVTHDNPVVEYSITTRCEGSNAKYYSLVLFYQDGSKKVHNSKDRGYLGKFIPMKAKQV